MNLYANRLTVSLSGVSNQKARDTTDSFSSNAFALHRAMTRLLNYSLGGSRWDFDPTPQPALGSSGHPFQM